MEAILTSTSFKLASKWVVKLSNQLIQIHSERKKELDEIANIFGNPSELAEYYVEPDCQQFNPAEDNEDELSTVVREPIFRRIETFFSGSRREGKHQMLVLSDAGMGKTSLLLMLKLAHIVSFWPKSHNCILLKLGDDTLEKVSSYASVSDTILLLDALDEDPLSFGKIEKRLTDILAVSYNFKRVIVTCRTQFFSGGFDPFDRRGQVEVGGFMCPVIYNSFFSDEQVDKYLEKRFANSKDKKRLIKKSKILLEKMGSLRLRPMLLTHIEDFLESNETNWQEHTIYRALIRAWLLREQRKAVNRKTEFPSTEKLINACRILAVQLQYFKKRHISAKDFEEISKKNTDLSELDKIDIGGRSLLNKNSDGEYRFAHYSIQEYLVIDAYLYGNMPINSNINKTKLMYSFYINCLKDDKNKVKRTRPINMFSLKNANLSNKNLDLLNFENTNFENANLHNTSLLHTNLKDSNFKFCNLSSADLRGSDLTNTLFDQCNFDSTNLFNTNLHKSSVNLATYKCKPILPKQINIQDINIVQIGDKVSSNG